MKLSAKHASIVLAFLLCLALVAGCTPAITTITTKTSEATATTTAATTTATTTTEATDKPVVDISIELVFLPATLAEDQSDNVLVQYIEDKFSVNLKFIPSDAEKQRLHLSTGQAGDIISLAPWLGTTDLMQQGVDEEIFVNIGDLVDAEPERFSTMVKMFTEPLYQYFNSYYYGIADEFYSMYALDYTRNVAGAPIYNKKIMDELGLEIPKTVDEFVEYLRAVKANKPNTIPFYFRCDKGTWLTSSSGDINQIFFQTYGLNASKIVQNTDGSWRDTAIDEANKIVWKRLAGMYTDGLIDKEIFTKEADSFMANDFVTGNIAVATSQLPNGNASSTLYPYDAFKTANPEIDPTDFLDYIVYQQDPLTGPSGYGKTTAVAKSVPFCSFITSTCKNPDRALDVLNWIISDDGQTVLNYGIEGVHYDSLDDQGRVVGYDVAKFKEDNMVWGQGGLSFGFLLLSGSATRYLPDRYGWSESVMHKENLADGGLSGGGSGGLPENLATYANDIYNRWSTDYYEELPSYYSYISFTDEYKQIGIKVNEVKVKYFVGFIFGTYDVEKDWTGFVNDFEAAGGSKYATEYGRLLEIEKAKFEALGD